MSDADLRALIREIPDFPRAGIGFKDITPLMADARALAECVRQLAEYARPLRVDCVVAAEARGFLLGPALALELGAVWAGGSDETPPEPLEAAILFAPDGATGEVAGLLFLGCALIFAALVVWYPSGVREE